MWELTTNRTSPKTRKARENGSRTGLKLGTRTCTCLGCVLRCKFTSLLPIEGGRFPNTSITDGSSRTLIYCTVSTYTLYAVQLIDIYEATTTLYRCCLQTHLIPGFRNRIHFRRIRIQHFLNSKFVTSGSGISVF